VEPDDSVIKLLASIDRRLALLTAPQERALRETLKEELLPTPSRVAMFEGINGERGSGELSKLGQVGERSAQLFVKELLELGLVRPASTSAGKAVIVEHDDAAILDWYLRRGTASD
jgi:hypothetical protein